MILNIYAPKKPVLSLCALSKQLKHTSKGVFPICRVVIAWRGHYIFEELIEQNSLFDKLVSVPFFEAFGGFILFKTLLGYLRVNFAPRHNCVVYKPVDYEEKRLNVVLVTDLVVL